MGSKRMVDDSGWIALEGSHFRDCKRREFGSGQEQCRGRLRVFREFGCAPRRRAVPDAEVPRRFPGDEMWPASQASTSRRRSAWSLLYSTFTALGRSSPRRFAQKVGIPEQRRVNQLTDAEVLQIRETIDRDYHRRRRSAARSRHEHQAADGSRLLSRPAPSPRPARERPAHPHQRAHAQGQGEADRRQEESRPRNARKQSLRAVA